MKNNNNWPGRRFPDLTAGVSALALLMLLAGCASEPPVAVSPPANGTQVVVDDAGPVSALTYYQMLHRMTPAQINRERMVLAALPTTPNTDRKSVV